MNGIVRIETCFFQLFRATQDFLCDFDDLMSQCCKRQSPLSVFQIRVLPNFMEQDFTTNLLPFALVQLFQNERNCFCLQANTWLALVVKWSVQAACIKVNLHGKVSIA